MQQPGIGQAPPRESQRGIHRDRQYYANSIASPNYWGYSSPWDSNNRYWDQGWYSNSTGVNYDNNGYSNNNAGNYPNNNSKPSADLPDAYVPPHPLTSVGTSEPGTTSVALDTALKASPEWRQADEAVRIARTEYDSESARVLNALHESPAYQAAVQRKQAGEHKIEAFKGSSTAPAPDQAIPAAQEKLNAAQTVTQMEIAAIAADPQASAAKSRLTSAIAQRDSARHAVEATVPKPVPAAAVHASP